MRISVDENDPGHGAASLTAKVFLDGAQIDYCVTADDATGECVVYVLGVDGAPKMSGPQCGAKPLTEVRRGEVKIVLPS
jgi:hypothetical protein